MARSTRAALLETRTARLKLPVRKKPYSVRISPSLRLGYRRNQTAGVWSVIVTDGKGGSWMKKFALADDFEDSEGRHVLDIRSPRPVGSENALEWSQFLISWEFPRLCRGGSRSLTFRAVAHRGDFQT
jgi:hypothetical protein